MQTDMCLYRIILLGGILGSTSLTTLTMADEGKPAGVYRPAFQVDLAVAPGTVTAAYLKAAKSVTPELAIKRWEAFLREYGEDNSIEDLTDITLIRQAHLELMRLYYTKGRTRDGDRLLEKANSYAIYSVPTPAQGEQWCRENKFCK